MSETTLHQGIYVNVSDILLDAIINKHNYFTVNVIKSGKSNNVVNSVNSLPCSCKDSVHQNPNKCFEIKFVSERTDFRLRPVYCYSTVLQLTKEKPLCQPKLSPAHALQCLWGTTNNMLNIHWQENEIFPTMCSWLKLNWPQ